MAVIMAMRAGPTQSTTPLERLQNRTIALHRHMGPLVADLEFPSPEYPSPDFGYDDERLHVSGSYRGPKMILESPFYCPGPEFRYVQRSKYCDSRLLQLLSDLRDYVELLETERDIESQPEKTEFLLTRRLPARNRLLCYKSIHSPPTDAGGNIVRSKDYIYECVRLCGLGIVHLSDTCLSNRAAFPPPQGSQSSSEAVGGQSHLQSPEARPQSATPSLTRSLVSTRLENIPPLIVSPPPSHIIPLLTYNLRKGPNPLTDWDVPMSGVLYWVLIAAGVFSVGHPESLLIIALGSKTVFDMTMSTNDRTWDEAFVSSPAQSVF